MVGTVIDNSANSNLGNITNQGQQKINNSVMPVVSNNKSTVLSWTMPNYSSIIELGTANPLSWQCPEDGWLQFQGGTTSVSVYLDNTSGQRIAGYTANSSISSGVVMPVVKGQTYYFTGGVAWRHYWKCKGV